MSVMGWEFWVLLLVIGAGALRDGLEIMRLKERLAALEKLAEIKPEPGDEPY